MQTVDLEKTGMRIKSLVKENNLKVKDVMQATDASVGAIYKWYNGEALPSVNRLIALAELLDVNTIEDLLVMKSS